MKASRYGYMGPEFKAMYDVGVIICSRYLRNVPILLKNRRTSACKIDHPVGQLSITRGIEWQHLKAQH